MADEPKPGGPAADAPPAEQRPAAAADAARERHKRALAAAAEPPELPPGTQSVFQGLSTGPKYDDSFDEPMANSSIFVLPTMTAPAAMSRSVTVAS